MNGMIANEGRVPLGSWGGAPAAASETGAGLAIAFSRAAMSWRTSVTKAAQARSLASPCQCERSAVSVSWNMLGRSQGSIIAGAKVFCRLASVASARTHRLSTERFDHSTTTALAVRSAFSVTSSYASPVRRPKSYQTDNACASNASTNTSARAQSSRLQDRKMSHTHPSAGITVRTTGSAGRGRFRLIDANCWLRPASGRRRRKISKAQRRDLAVNSDTGWRGVASCKPLAAHLAP